MHDLGQRTTNAAVARRLATTAERVILASGLISVIVVLLAALGRL